MVKEWLQLSFFVILALKSNESISSSWQLKIISGLASTIFFSQYPIDSLTESIKERISEFLQSTNKGKELESFCARANKTFLLPVNLDNVYANTLVKKTSSSTSSLEISNFKSMEKLP